MSLDQRFVEHIVQSIETQVGFLVESGRLSAPDADLIKSKVRQASVVGGADTLVTSLSQVQLDPNQNSQPNNVAAGAVHSHQQQRSNRVVPPIPTKPGSLRSSEPPAPAAVAPPAPSEPKKQLARALWDYNSQTPGDLSFAKNDTVEILREENEHWFFGQCGPHQGLFPSNYVERLPDAAMNQSQFQRAVPPPPPPQTMGYGQYAAGGYGQPQQHHAPPPPMYNTSEKSGAPPTSYYQPPPPQHQYSGGPPQPIVVSGTPPEQKKNRFGGLGNTMAHGAAGGVGFGLASSAVNSIF